MYPVQGCNQISWQLSLERVSAVEVAAKWVFLHTFSTKERHLV